MKDSDTIKLDNPAWYSLAETHKGFAIGYNGLKFYQPDYCIFGGFEQHNLTKDGMNRYALLTDDFFIIGDRPLFDDRIRLKKELVCDQMVLDNRINLPISENIIRLETTNQKSDLFDLVNLVQPGYFKIRTADLGDYYGIYQDGKLIAVTGERMKMDKYTEVSAVITHPGHRGKGYARQLITFTCNKIIDEGRIPYLHVAETNTGAINLYEKLGFWTRRKISFWNFTAHKQEEH